MVESTQREQMKMKKWIELHNFFCENANSYLTEDSTFIERFDYFLEFSVAYVQFMWHSRGD